MMGPVNKRHSPTYVSKSTAAAYDGLLRLADWYTNALYVRDRTQKSASAANG